TRHRPIRRQHRQSGRDSTPLRGQRAAREYKPEALVALAKSPARNSSSRYAGDEAPLPLLLSRGYSMRGRKPRSVTLAPGDLAHLQHIARQPVLPFFQVQRARIVLARAAGEAIHSIASRWECDPAT